MPWRWMVGGMRPQKVARIRDGQLLGRIGGPVVVPLQGAPDNHWTREEHQSWALLELDRAILLADFSGSIQISPTTPPAIMRTPHSANPIS